MLLITTWLKKSLNWLRGFFRSSKPTSETFAVAAPKPMTALKGIAHPSRGKSFGTFSPCRPFARTRQIRPGLIVRIG